ncbi:hypothetical protein CCUS01_16759 [Colletotrichum cuscutae]|uniref:Uncharacterized protein n=1 Tax=Colletotrichum cuscutae TaxID=1209917 RepID=A0AAI9V8D8_9PEZI|nr:hypothetical protein CCUS01_16759 [Colletotrichum cuscutae]
MSALDFRTFEPTGSLAEDKSYLAGAKIMKHYAKALDGKDCATRSRAAMPRTGGPGSAVPKYGKTIIDLSSLCRPEAAKNPDGFRSRHTIKDVQGGGPNAILSKLWEDATDGGVDIDRGSSGLRLVRARKQPPDNGHWRLELGLLAPGRDGKSQGPLVTNPTEAKKSVALGKTSDRASPGHQGPPSTGQRRNGLFLKMVEAKNSPVSGPARGGPCSNVVALRDAPGNQTTARDGVECRCKGGARIGLGSCMICAGPIGFEWLLPRTQRCMLHSGTRCCCSSQLRCTNNTVTRVRFGLWRDRCPPRRSQEISASHGTSGSKPRGSPADARPADV